MKTQHLQLRVSVPPLTGSSPRIGRRRRPGSGRWSRRAAADTGENSRRCCCSSCRLKSEERNKQERSYPHVKRDASRHVANVSQSRRCDSHIDSLNTCDECWSQNFNADVTSTTHSVLVTSSQWRHRLRWIWHQSAADIYATLHCANDAYTSPRQQTWTSDVAHFPLHWWLLHSVWH